ncbi:Quinone oxidoreductase 1 [Streptomyces sp. YIM 130001]|nr:Quinone oxidoreductase 1 [Streptomyces sp. YIM 130001]
MEAASVNHSENLALEGGKYAEGLPFPCLLGYEGAGTVVAVGPDVELNAGELACWSPFPGSCADYLLAPAAVLVPVPPGLTAEQAAAIPSAGAASQLLADVWPLRGRHAVVRGAAGPVGRLLVAVLAEAGAEVIGIAAGDRTAAVTAAGAVLGIDRTTQDVVGAVEEHTGGAGAAAVFDPVGPATYRRSLEMLVPRGCYVNYGQLSGELPVVELTDLMDRGLFVTKFGGGGIEGREQLRELVASALDLAVRTPGVVSDDGGRFPLDRAAQAYRELLSGPSGKTLVVPGG